VVSASVAASAHNRSARRGKCNARVDVDVDIESDNYSARRSECNERVESTIDLKAKRQADLDEADAYEHRRMLFLNEGTSL
jgi:hypothetical protein